MSAVGHGGPVVSRTPPEIARATARDALPPARTPTAAPGVDARGLVVDLLNNVRGEVRFDAGSRALYATDASNYRQVPIGVVIPRDVDDVVATVAAARRFGAPILSRGGGTSLAGQTCNVAVVMDWSKHVHQLLELDPGRRVARVRPGIVLDELRDAAEQHHLTFGPDPATHDHCTLGGMIGNNSCGVHSVMAGKTVDNVEELEILTYRGDRFRVGATPDDEFERVVASGGPKADIYRALRDLRDRHADEIRARFPDIPRRVSGYNLDQLLPDRGFHVARALVGTESTCVTVLEATVRLVDSPRARSLLVLGYPDVYQAADHVPDVMATGPIACEGLDQGLVDDMLGKGLHPDTVQELPDGHGWLLVEYGGDDRKSAETAARAAMDALGGGSDAPTLLLLDRASQEARIWKVRESGLGATAMIPDKPSTEPGWEDSAVPPARLGDYLRELDKLWARFGYKADMYGHFGQGVLHCRVDFDLRSARGLKAFRAYLDDAADLVVRFGGSLSGEHGDGQARGALLSRMYGERLVGAFEEFKDIWDPDGRMNPGKVVRPNAILSDLRLGVTYAPPALDTHFAYPEDHGSFAHAALRCVGVGECRRHDGGVMCPSYMATREEQHSTRGRARLLFEMLNGEELAGQGWRSEPVREALDLCLACKGCKGDCPVNVDMATYKAEFLSHYYAGRRRPMAAYSMGLIHWWARLASHAPHLANVALRAPIVSTLAKRVAGVAPERSMPRFAARTFRSWFGEHRRDDGRDDGRPEVILWTDTFNDHFHPTTLRSALQVLEAAGYRVIIPPRALCCGRPLYDWGMLDVAKRLLRQCVGELRGPIRDGVPIVGLEPSCVSVFRDELTNMFPDDVDAGRLHDQTYLLSEFLDTFAPGFHPGGLTGKVLVQDHCHQVSVLTTDAERRLLAGTGLEVEAIDGGCCGMAGAFGFEAGEHYGVSIAVGEHAVLPAVRAAAKDTIIVADGFSCREQIGQSGGRRAVHLADILATAVHRGEQAPHQARATAD